MIRAIAWTLLLVVVAGGAWLRLARLDNRPMHGDEAVHAAKLRFLLDSGEYTYDPREYHGPTLNFLTLPVAWAAGAARWTEVTETHLRLVPAVFGIALVGLVWLLREELGRAAALWAALLAALSPAMVFYSRYYIQEMLLVCFTLCAMVALWRYVGATGGLSTRASGADTGRRAARGTRPGIELRGIGWLVLLGCSIGLMHATKETCVLALGAMAVAAAASIPRLRRAGSKRLIVAGLVVALAAAGVSALFFSSFWQNPRGVADSYLTYAHYLHQAGGEGSEGEHVYPFHHYLERLFAWRRGEGPVWSEGAIALVALAGLFAAGFRRGLEPGQVPLARFLAVYTVLLTLAYSALPYKTPWCALGFLHGMILLGGIGAAALVRLVPGWLGKSVCTVVLLAAAGQLGWQAHRASFDDFGEPANPYVYAQPLKDAIRLADRVRAIAAVHPDGKAMHVQVICPDRDYWPLPWYLRDFTRIGWFSEPPESPAAPLIVTQPVMEAALMEYLYVRPPPGERPLYMPGPPGLEERQWQLRPHVPLAMYVRRDLWEMLYEAP